MPRLFESSVEALLPNSLYLTLLLAGAAVFVLWSGSFRRIGRIALVMLAVWAWALSTPGVSRLLLSQLEFAYPTVELSKLKGSDDIVVLASGSTEEFGGRPVIRLDRPAWERTRAGVELWKQAGRKRLLFVGGPRAGTTSPSAEMAAIAVQFGVPSDAVVVDDRALTTREGFERLDPEALNLTPGAWLVTSAIHMSRALKSARTRGLALRPFACDYMSTDSPGWREWLPGTIAYRLNIELMHEYIGKLYYSLLDRI